MTSRVSTVFLITYLTRQYYGHVWTCLDICEDHTEESVQVSLGNKGQKALARLLSSARQLCRIIGTPDLGIRPAFLCTLQRTPPFREPRGPLPLVCAVSGSALALFPSPRY